MPENSRNLALIGVEVTEWWPSIRPTAEGAHGLTQAIVGLAHHALEEERKSSSEIPSLMVKQIDTKTGEITEILSLAYEAVLRERALTYLQSLKLEADASVLEILADIFERQLYLHHPDQWGSLSQFLTSMAAGKSQSYQSTIEGLVTTVLPYLQVNELASVRDLMEMITSGDLSNLYHLKSEMVQAVMDDDPDEMAELLQSAKTMTREGIVDKYKRGRSRIPPAKAMLSNSSAVVDFGYTRVLCPYEMQGPGQPATQRRWRLVVTMTDSQKGVILNTLGGKIVYE